jgi:hypothetical protein
LKLRDELFRRIKCILHSYLSTYLQLILHSLSILLPTILQARKTKRQAGQDSVQERNNTGQHNIQNCLHGQDQQAQRRNHRRSKHDNQSSTQDKNGGTESSENLDNDETKKSSNGNGANLTLLYVLYFDAVDEALGLGRAGVGKCIDLRSRRGNCRSNLVDLIADSRGSGGFLERGRVGGEVGESSICEDLVSIMAT